MDSTSLFYLIIAILVIDFILERGLSYLNYTWYSKPVPEELADVYDTNEYAKSQQYKMARYKFGTLSATVSFIAILIFLFADGFALVDSYARSIVEGSIPVALVFFAIIAIAGELISLPFSYYSTFVIEEKFGFNKTTVKTFILDKMKGLFLTALLGGGLLSLIIWLYGIFEEDFWWMVWIIVTLFALIMNMFYARLIVPLFNKQTPLGEGDLRSEIEQYADQEGFDLSKIYIIDGSKRSTKANAYFSGFGREKRVTLYDTLIEKLSTKQVVAVLAHEVGHYRKKHIIYNLIASVLTTGLTLYIFSLIVGSPLLSDALGVELQSFHVGLVAFGLLYSPISTITGVLMAALSRKFEYQADRFAADTYAAEPLVEGLKELSKNSLSNLTPHPAYVFFHYSHPSLAERMRAMKV